jgi:hypothetical protein
MVRFHRRSVGGGGGECHRVGHSSENAGNRRRSRRIRNGSRSPCVGCPARSRNHPAVGGAHGLPCQPRASTIRKWAERSGLRTKHDRGCAVAAAVDGARLTWTQRRADVAQRSGDAAAIFLERAIEASVLKQAGCGRRSAARPAVEQKKGDVPLHRRLPGRQDPVRGHAGRLEELGALQGRQEVTGAVTRPRAALLIATPASRKLRSRR